MTQKLITVGNSKAITISKDFLRQIGDADVAKIKFEPEKKRMIVDFDPQQIVDTVVDPEVYAVATSLMKRYGKALAELASK